MSEVLFVLFFVVLHVCGSSEGQKIITAEPGQNITAEPGQNITLTCDISEKYTDIHLEWSRDGLGRKKVFVFKDGRPFPAAQHESFRNRVFLKDRQMKDGDLSVVLKNVTMNDTGTYECRVRHEKDPEGSDFELISSSDLSVVPPGDKGGQRGGGDGENEEEAGLSKGYIGGIVVGVILLLGVAAAGLFWIYKKRKNQHRGSPEPNEQQTPLRSQNKNPEASAD